ncbi:unnamed protein product [Echinostoma caproni]|uniref:PHD domain-containing protein n=1 Tax=Echinostoma caproni TaxID=27848 RepID=A0A183BF35_9TREM|nr:unnamed protein product [Echinostoma caproni]
MPRVNFPCLNEVRGKKVVSGIMCNVCEKWAHQKCTGVSTEICALYGKHSGLYWMCNGCETIARQHIAQSAVPGKSPRLTATKGVEIIEEMTAEVSAKTYAKVVKKSPGKPSPGTRQLQPNAKTVKSKPKTVNPRIVKGARGILGNSLHHIESKLHRLRAEIDSIKAVRVNRTSQYNTLLVLNKEEPIIRESKTRRELDRRRVTDILRLVGLDP